MKWIDEQIEATKRQIKMTKQSLLDIQNIAIKTRDTINLLQGRLEALTEVNNKLKEENKHESARQKTVPSKNNPKNP